jgi:hypothetical protein
MINPLNTKLVCKTFNNSVRTTKKTHFTVKNDQLVNAVWGNNSCLLSKLYEAPTQSAVLLVVEAGDSFTYHYVLQSQNTAEVLLWLTQFAAPTNK